MDKPKDTRSIKHSDKCFMSEFLKYAANLRVAQGNSKDV
jgi:hypothetical protein